MSEAIDAGMMYATLTGGECLTHPDFDRLYLYLHSRGVQITVLTNAVLLDDARMKFFLKHPPAGIQVTLYGMDEDSYERVTGRREFNRVMENVRRADAAGLPLSISITPNKYLGKDNERLVRFAAQTGLVFNVNTSLMTPREETGRSDGFCDLNWDDYMRLLKLQHELKGGRELSERTEELPDPGGNASEAPVGLRCGGGRSSFAVSWNGELSPCNSLHQLASRPLEKGFEEAWKEVNERVRNYALPCECEGCPYRNAANPCAAAHHAQPGHADKRECEKCRALVKAGIVSLE